MSFIPTINAIKIVIIGSIAGQQVVIDITIRTPAAVGGTDLDDAADAVEDWLVDDLLPELSLEYSVNEIKAYDLSSAVAPVVSHFVAHPGLVAVEPVALNTALVASFRTANRGRSGRGRNYVPALQNNIGDSGSTTIGKATSIATAYAALNGHLSPFGFEHVVDSLFTLGSPRAAGFTQEVVEYIVNINYDSQRRRLVGRGA